MINYYIAKETKYGTAMYNGYAENEEEFVNMCKDADYDLTDLEIEEMNHDIKPNFGRMPSKGVGKDLGTI